MMTLPGVNAKITTKDSCIPEANTNKKQQIVGIHHHAMLNSLDQPPAVITILDPVQQR